MPDPMQRPRRLVLWRILGGFGVAMVIAASLAPASSLPSADVSDKTAHLVAYGSLALWFHPLCAGWVHRSAIAVALIAMGVTLEFLQPILSDRTFEAADMVANSAGVALGLGLGSAGANRWLGLANTVLDRILPGGPGRAP